jgi:triacylglycerol lipase
MLPALDPRRQIRITGHSLGGAVAAILAALLAEDPAGFTLGRTITFGQPMVTDINGARLLRKHSLLRVVNRADPVAMLPLILSRTHFEFPPTLLFHHFGSQITLFPDGRALYSEAKTLANVVFGYEKFLANHDLNLYLQRLSALAD